MASRGKYLVLLLLFLSLLIPVASALPPKCILSVDKPEGTAPHTIKVSELSGDKTIVDNWYDFGDEQYLYHKLTGDHTYDKAGTFVVTLHVVNDKGEEATDKVTVTVTAAEPTPTPTPTPKPTMNPTVKVVYQGETPIKNAIDAKVGDKISILKAETDKVMKETKFPIDIVSGKTTLRIIKYKCDEKMGICGYWVEAYRDGKEIYTNSPIWISPPPYEVVVSESLDTKLNELTVTIKEDPKTAVERVLQRYVEMQPLGKAVSYER